MNIRPQSGHNQTKQSREITKAGASCVIMPYVPRAVARHHTEPQLHTEATSARTFTREVAVAFFKNIEPASMLLLIFQTRVIASK